jgi:hypothetical protein
VTPSDRQAIPSDLKRSQAISSDPQRPTSDRQATDKRSPATDQRSRKQYNGVRKATYDARGYDVWCCEVRKAQ